MKTLACWTMIAACGAAQAQGLRVELDLPNELNFLTLPATVGTNIPKAKVVTLPAKPGQVAEIVASPIVAALKACDLTVKVREARAADTIGGTTTPLTGLGMYSSFLANRTAEHKALYVAPYVAIHVVLARNGKPVREMDVVGYEKRTLQPDERTDQFFEEHADELVALLKKLVSTRVGEELAAVKDCGAG